MNTGSGGIAFTKDKRFFRLAGNDEVSALNFSAHKEAFRSILGDILQALYVSRMVPDWNKQHTIPILPHIAEGGNAFAPQIDVFRRTRGSGVENAPRLLRRRLTPLRAFRLTLPSYGVLTPL